MTYDRRYDRRTVNRRGYRFAQGYSAQCNIQRRSYGGYGTVYGLQIGIKRNQLVLGGKPTHGRGRWEPVPKFPLVTLRRDGKFRRPKLKSRDELPVYFSMFVIRNSEENKIREIK